MQAEGKSCVGQALCYNFTVSLTQQFFVQESMTMSTEPDAPDSPPEEIDLEQLLQLLLVYNSDEHTREGIVSRIAQKTGLIPEKIETILHATLEYLVQHTRSN
jgi:hypothetical protein